VDAGGSRDVDDGDPRLGHVSSFGKPIALNDSDASLESRTVARISYVDENRLADPELRAYLDDARRFGTPRPETQSIRSHVPAVAKAFSRAWDAIFRNGIVEHSLKELCRVYVSQTIECNY